MRYLALALDVFVFVCVTLLAYLCCPALAILYFLGELPHRERKFKRR